jgi:hypothetical protein
MVSLKVYLLIGWAFLIGAVAQPGSFLEALAWTGVVAVLLGLSQPYVSLPEKLKLAGAILFVAAAVIGVVVHLVVVSTILGLLVFVIQFVGAVRYKPVS